MSNDSTATDERFSTVGIFRLTSGGRHVPIIARSERVLTHTVTGLNERVNEFNALVVLVPPIGIRPRHDLPGAAVVDAHRR